jgi:ribosomal protein S18 acetylase RimI-like enzyme
MNQRNVPMQEIKSLGCFAKRHTGEVVGGAVGRTWGFCCELRQLWIAEEYRHRGIATRLVALLEERAGSRGCHTFYLETFSFQAPELYHSLGYVVKLEVKGFPNEITKFTMTKELK